LGLFEFLMVLISVFIGLGLTEILTGMANLLRARREVRFYWLHILFQCGVFFALTQQWWEFWNLQEIGEISYLSVLLILAPSIFLFLIANLLYPDQIRGSDLEEYYYRQASLLWGLVIAGTLIGTFLWPWVFGGGIFNPGNISGIPMLILCSILAVSNNRRVHSILCPLVLLMVILDTVLPNPVISAG